MKKNKTMLIITTVLCIMLAVIHGPAIVQANDNLNPAAGRSEVNWAEANTRDEMVREINIEENSTGDTLDDSIIVIKDREDLEIEFSADDYTDRVTDDVWLPIFGDYGSDISWTSDREDVVDSCGTVVRPLDEDVQVTLTATLVYGQATVSKIFTVTVLRLPADERWEDREVSTLQNSHKTWTIRFNQAVNMPSAQENIYVAQDYRGLGLVSVVIAATDDPRVITVTAEEYWPSGILYLFISRELCSDSANHPQLARGIRMRFRVE